MPSPNSTHNQRLCPASALALLATLAAAAALLLSACGSSSNEAVAQIEGSPQTVTKPMLNHWMRAMSTGDFRAVIGTKGPLGLVSEPANYSECEAAAKKIIPRSFTGKLRLSEANIQRKCHELYTAIKEQALDFLLSVQWEITLGQEQGLKVSEAQLQKEFARYSKEIFKSEAGERQYLAERHWVLSDVLYQLKRNILVSEILPKFEAKVKAAGGGEATYAKLALERYKHLVSRTDCKPGYVAENCRQYREPSTTPPSPNELLEGFVQAVARV